MQKARSVFKHKAKSLFEIIIFLQWLKSCVITEAINTTRDSNINWCIWQNVSPCLPLIPASVREKIEDYLHNDWLPLDNDVGQARHWAFACYLTGSIPFESNCIECTTPQHGCTFAVREERQSEIWNDICELYCGPISLTSATTNRLLALITTRARPTLDSTTSGTSIYDQSTTQYSDKPSSINRVNSRSDTPDPPASYWSNDGRTAGSTIPVAAQVIVLITILFTIFLLFAIFLVYCLRNKSSRTIGANHTSSGATSATASTFSSSSTVEFSKLLLNESESKNGDRAHTQREV